jgi:hypothetical protein
MSGLLITFNDCIPTTTSIPLKRRQVEKINSDTERCDCESVPSIFGIQDWSVVTLASPHY